MFEYKAKTLMRKEKTITFHTMIYTFVYCRFQTTAETALLQFIATFLENNKRRLCDLHTVLLFRCPSLPWWSWFYAVPWTMSADCWLDRMILSNSCETSTYKSTFLTSRESIKIYKITIIVNIWPLGPVVVSLNDTDGLCRYEIFGL